ncbi:MAG: C25 family cysteine peptidase [Candidatus Syntrophosphaera sp.]|jgi:hypothetical protein|nr:C25 family cysteine peptidase [Candidatus Cloacimonadota bacterium]MDX9949785.1 C25 family cysteine peptidase [Candidatus Syntrophosphaera sp.]
MNKLIPVLLLLALPFFVSAAQLSLSLELNPPLNGEFQPGWGTLSSPGSLRLPLKTINVVLPPGAEDVSHRASFSGLRSVHAPAPELNPPFFNSEGLLTGTPNRQNSPQVIYYGLKRWGDVNYASFGVLPVAHQGETWEAWENLHLELNWNQAEGKVNSRIPPVWKHLSGKNFQPRDFFVNPQDIDAHYQLSPTRSFDYLIISTPALYQALAPLESFRQSQGFITAFQNINTILAGSPGASDGEKLRNHLISQYNDSPFSHLLLVGDYDTVPVLYLCPEPNATNNVASDFFYGDLSSIIDTDGDGRLGEYSAAYGFEDYLCDFTPEVLVGRISTNNAGEVSQIATRTVDYEQSSAPWKKRALLPAAYLNYGGEPDPSYLQTDGATFMEYVKATALSDWDCDTMYEQTGFLPSYPSTLALDYDLLKNQLDTQSYGILNWSAHGSSDSSSRKVWISDDNGNNLPDAWEMQWRSMVDLQSFNNLTNPDGSILFAASCYNGRIDGSQPCLAEHAMLKKTVASIGATRTGWYKMGWSNPGWGGLSSYNYHWLENFARNELSLGAAHALTGFIHSQYYLFGDPLDDGGVIWPELQNVYTYLLYGDPAIGHIGAETPLGQILIYEPNPSNSLELVDCLINSRFNVIHTDKLIPDYDYINQFDAVFCLFGNGAETLVPAPGSLDYNLLTSYLDGGGNLYLEGDLPWESASPFWQKFGTSAPAGQAITLSEVQTQQAGQVYNWGYSDPDNPQVHVLQPDGDSAQTLFTSENPAQPLGILNQTNTYTTIASSFELSKVQGGTPHDELYTLLAIILDKFGLISFIPVEAEDAQIPAAELRGHGFPNPFTSGIYIDIELPKAAQVKLDIYNLRGQKVRSLAQSALPAGNQQFFWDGRDQNQIPSAPGIYFWRLDAGENRLQGKILKLSN